MRKVKLVVHECYAGKRKSEEVFAALFYLRCHWQPHRLLMALAGTLPGSYDYLGQKVKVKYYDIYVDKATGQLAIFQKSTGNLVVITDYFI